MKCGMYKISLPVFSLLCMLLLVSSKPANVLKEPEVPVEIARKFKRDAARLSLRNQVQDNDLRYMPIQISGTGTDKIYTALCQIYIQTDQGKGMERCNIHTFPNPSIDHMVIIYQKSQDWASPLQKGLMQTNSSRFNDLVNKYKLVFERHVQWTENQNAITLRAKEPLNMAALANEFSQIEGVSEIDLGIPKSLGNDIQARRIDGAWEFEYVLRFGAWSSGKGESHSWRFTAADNGKIIAQGDSGAPIPTWMKCQFDPTLASTTFRL